MDDTTFFMGANKTWSDGDKLVYGKKGKVKGPGTGAYKDKGVSVKFPGNTDTINCYLTQLSRTPPPKEWPGDYKLNDMVYFMGANKTYPSGNKVEYGHSGKVKGPATAKDFVGKGVLVMFPGNKGNVNCYLTQLSRTPPDPVKAEQEKKAIEAKEEAAAKEALMKETEAKKARAKEATAQKEELRERLTQLGLSQFADAIVNEGYDSVEMLAEMDDHEFKELTRKLRMGGGHVKKLKKLLCSSEEKSFKTIRSSFSSLSNLRSSFSSSFKR